MESAVKVMAGINPRKWVLNSLFLDHITSPCLQPPRWPPPSGRHCRRGARESGDDYPADQVDGAVVEAEEAHAETQALKLIN